jgi:hypothetical protein
MLRWLLVLLLSSTPTSHACPANYQLCEPWTNTSIFPKTSMVGVKQITTANVEKCSIVGLPKAWMPLTKYTFAVVSNYIVSRKVYVSAGTIVGSSKSGPNKDKKATEAEKAYVKAKTAHDDSAHDHSAHAHRNLAETTTKSWLDTESCYDCGRPAHGSVLFDWIAPEGGNGTITFASLCGGSELGSGGAGFVAAASHVKLTEKHNHGKAMRHTCTDTVVTAMDDYQMSGLKAKDTSGNADHSGHSGTFSSFVPGVSAIAVLFDGWNVTTWGSYIATLLAMFVLGIVCRLLRIPLASFVREKSDSNSNDMGNVKYNVFIWLGFFIVQAISYSLMLVSMTMDVGFFLSIVSGMATGFVMQNSQPCKKTNNNSSSVKSDVHGGKDVEMSSSTGVVGDNDASGKMSDDEIIDDCCS